MFWYELDFTPIHVDLHYKKSRKWQHVLRTKTERICLFKLYYVWFRTCLVNFCKYGANLERFDSENTSQIESLITIKVCFGLESTVPYCGEIDFINNAGCVQCGVFDHQPTRVTWTTGVGSRYVESPNGFGVLKTTWKEGEERVRMIKMAIWRNKIFVKNCSMCVFIVPHQREQGGSVIVVSSEAPSYLVPLYHQEGVQKKTKSISRLIGNNGETFKNILSPFINKMKNKRTLYFSGSPWIF